MEDIAVSLPEVKLVKSIPGIGTKLSAAIIAEMGDVRQFSDAKQLVAFAGLDPGLEFLVQGSLLRQAHE